jgi:hypothetical protein
VSVIRPVYVKYDTSVAVVVACNVKCRNTTERCGYIVVCITERVTATKKQECDTGWEKWKKRKQVTLDLIDVYKNHLANLEGKFSD